MALINVTFKFNVAILGLKFDESNYNGSFKVDVK